MREGILNGLQEVALLRLVAVLEELSDVLTHTGCLGVSLRAPEKAIDGDECIPTVILDILTVFQ